MSTHAQPAVVPQPAPRRRLQLVTRRALPWEQPAFPVAAVAAVEVAPTARERERRGTLAREVSQLPLELVQQLLLEEVAEAPAQIRHAVLIRQLDETAPPKRGALLGQHLRWLGASLTALLVPLDARAWLSDGMPEDDRLLALLARLGVDTGSWPVPATLEVVGERASSNERLCEGHRGGAVTRMQQRLHVLGYLTDGALAQVCGTFDRPTAGALRAFQADHGLPATGDLGPQSHRALLTAVSGR